MRDFKDTVQTKTISSKDIQRALAKGPDYCSAKLKEFLHHASTLMQSMQSLYMEDADVMALMSVAVHCTVTVQSSSTGEREEIAVFGFGTENEAAHGTKEG